MKTKTKSINPTLKQKKALKYYIENHGNVSKSMKQAGYSLATAKNPKNLTKSKGWQFLLNKYLPDERLTQKISEHIDSNDSRVSLQAVDMSLKLKNKYPANKIKLGVYKEIINEITE